MSFWHNKTIHHCHFRTLFISAYQSFTSFSLSFSCVYVWSTHALYMHISLYVGRYLNMRGGGLVQIWCWESSLVALPLYYWGRASRWNPDLTTSTAVLHSQLALSSSLELPGWIPHPFSILWRFWRFEIRSPGLPDKHFKQMSYVPSSQLVFLSANRAQLFLMGRKYRGAIVSKQEWWRPSALWCCSLGFVSGHLEIMGSSFIHQTIDVPPLSNWVMKNTKTSKTWLV